MPEVTKKKKAGLLIGTAAILVLIIIALLLPPFCSRQADSWAVQAGPETHKQLFFSIHNKGNLVNPCLCVFGTERGNKAEAEIVVIIRFRGE